MPTYFIVVCVDSCTSEDTGENVTPMGTILSAFLELKDEKAQAPLWL